MRKFVLLLCLLAALLPGKQSMPGAGFAGTWKASVNNTVFLIVSVRDEPRLNVRMSSVLVAADEHGNITDAEPAGQDHPVQNIAVFGDRLMFTSQDADDDPPTRFELRIAGEGVAELRVVGEDAPVKLRPILLRRS